MDKCFFFSNFPNTNTLILTQVSEQTQLSWSFSTEIWNAIKIENLVLGIQSFVKVESWSCTAWGERQRTMTTSNRKLGGWHIFNAIHNDFNIWFISIYLIQIAGWHKNAIYLIPWYIHLIYVLQFITHNFTYTLPMVLCVPVWFSLCVPIGWFFALSMKHKNRTKKIFLCYCCVCVFSILVQFI